MSRVVRKVLRRRRQSRGVQQENTSLQSAQERYRQRLIAPVAPPECPPGCDIGPPTFVGVGVQKAGTAWWYHHLISHPGVAGTVRKELHYFEHGWEREFDDQAVAWYHRYFPRPPGIVTGEWTPRYMLDPWTPPRLRTAAPDAKLLVLLRDPVARLQSGLRHHMTLTPDPLHPRFVIEAIERGRYATQLTHLLKHFPRQQILVLQLELCGQEPEREMARTYEFLGLDPHFVPDDLHRPIHPGRGEPISLPDDLERFAFETYRPDIEQLARDWPEIDLELWPTAKKAT